MSMKMLKITFVGLLGAAISAVISVLSSPSFNESQEFQGKKLLPGAYQSARLGLAGSEERSDRGYDEDGSLEDQVILNAILTIIQGYYVDEERSAPTSILDSACAGLRDRDVIKTSMQEFRGKQYCEFALPGMSIHELDGLDYRALVKLSLQIISQLDVSLERLKAQGLMLEYGSGLDLFAEAILSQLDPHSTILSAEEYKELKQGTQGRFGGLGVVVNVQDDILTVLKPIPNSPAEVAGVKAGDRIIAINDVLTFGVSLDDLVDHMRGEPGTSVRLTLLSKNGSGPREVTIERKIVDVPSVEAKLVAVGEDQAIYAAVESFSAATTDELRMAIEKLSSGRTISGIILDLRSNPGGLLDQAIQVADMFLSKGTIVSTVGRRNEVEIAFDENDDIRLPIAVLINEETASASEIVASALQDNNRALIIGTPSFGKGSVQTIFEIPRSRALKLTIARYYSPAGRAIQNSGVIPDIWLQEIGSFADNINVLGASRLSKESFQRGHLESKAISSQALSKEDAAYKAFVLGTESVDLPLSFAKELIADLAKVNGLPVPQDRLRRSFWLANSSALVKEKIETWNKKSEEALRQRLNINWEQRARVPRNLVSRVNQGLELVTQSHVNTYEGEKLRVEVKLRNKSSLPVERISLFVVSDEYDHVPQEVLVGRVEAHEEVRKTLEIVIPPSGEERTLRSLIGIAVDAEPIKEEFKKLTIRTVPRNEPSINYRVSLNSFSDTLPELSFLSPGSKGELVIAVNNDSNLKASDLQIGLVNLSGAQVRLMPKDDLVFDLDSYGRKVIRVPFKAADSFETTRFIFGLVIQGPAITKPIKGNFAVSRR